MATIQSQSDGNWSNTATWTGGVLPIAGDIALVDNAIVVDVILPALTSINMASAHAASLTCPDKVTDYLSSVTVININGQSTIATTNTAAPITTNGSGVVLTLTNVILNGTLTINSGDTVNWTGSSGPLFVASITGTLNCAPVAFPTVQITLDFNGGTFSGSATFLSLPNIEDATAGGSPYAFGQGGTINMHTPETEQNSMSFPGTMSFNGVINLYRYVTMNVNTFNDGGATINLMDKTATFGLNGGDWHVAYAGNVPGGLLRMSIGL